MRSLWIVLLFVGFLISVHASLNEPINVTFVVCHYAETCYNGIDDNCDGVIDEGCTIAPPVTPEAPSPGGGGSPLPPPVVGGYSLELQAFDAVLGDSPMINVIVKNNSNVETELALRLRLEKNGQTVFTYPVQKNKVHKGETIFVFDDWNATQAGRLYVIAELLDRDENKVLSSRAGVVTITAEFLFDIAIEDLKYVMRPGEDQNILILLHNKGQIEDDLVLTYWVEDALGRNISSQSTSLFIPSDKPLRINVQLPLPKTAPSGDYLLKAEISFGVQKASAFASFEIPLLSEYRSKVLEELNRRLKEAADLIESKKKENADTSDAERKWNDIQAQIHELTRESVTLPEEQFESNTDDLRSRLVRLLLDTHLLHPRPPILVSTYIILMVLFLFGIYTLYRFTKPYWPSAPKPKDAAQKPQE